MEVAEVVAVISAEDRGFERKMRDANQDVEDSTRQATAAERERRRELDATAAGLNRIRLGYLGAAAAAGSLFALASRGPIAGAFAQQRGLALDLIGDQLFRGTGLDDISRGVNRGLFDFARRLRDLRKAGGGNIAVGAAVTNLDTIVRDQGAAASQGAAAGAGAISFGGRAQQAGLGLLEILGALPAGAVGADQTGANMLARGTSRVGGALTSGPAMTDVERRLLIEQSTTTTPRIGPNIPAQFLPPGGPTGPVELLPQDRVRVDVNYAQDPEVIRALGQAFVDSIRRGLTGGYD